VTRGTSLVFMLAVSVAAVACKKPTTDKTGDAATTPKPNQLPPLEVKADTPNLLLTWIDDKGDFHVAQKPADVPTEGRGTVRVVVTNREEGTGALVYVANLDETTATDTASMNTRLVPRVTGELRSRRSKASPPRRTT
jgi:hypothetical protein